MSSQRYQPVRIRLMHRPIRASTDPPQINAHDDDDDDVDSPVTPSNNLQTPNSPPPSFRSRDSSPTSRRLLAQDPLNNDGERDLEDAFGDGSDDENEEDDRQRLMRANPNEAQQPTAASNSAPRATVERRVTELPVFRAPTRAMDQQANDGVFANLGAKLERGEQLDEKPPVCIHVSPTVTQY